ncbi:MAG TPA: alpha/beta hydrolase-fold protein [Prolixibacteraceae bacterium]|nr:alpha/beta hydrolase-fold protein [Prolixibacteraceae bacterium]
MNKKIFYVIVMLLIISIIKSVSAQPVNVSGTWKADIETPVGLFKYTWIIQQDGENLSGKILREKDNEKAEVAITEGKINDDAVSFVEMLSMPDQEIKISYSGKITGNELKLTRQVGDFATEEVTAKRDNPENHEKTANAEVRRNLMRPIVLNPDDKQAFPPAPEGYDKIRDNITHGKTETVEYESKTVGTTRKLLVYTPPGFSTDKKYPVLYLLHGIGGDELEWYNNGHPEVILDNLYADKKLVPMIVVFPNGRAMKNDRAEGNIYAPEMQAAFANFEKDLLNDVIPFVESKYPVKKERESRALAGLSMGGGQSLNFGLGNLDTFAWVGGFSSAPNTKAPEVLIPNPAETAKKLKLLWISCGNEDGLISFSQKLHQYCKENKVPHIWQVEPGKHEFPVWKNDLYQFSQLIFK